MAECKDIFDMGEEMSDPYVHKCCKAIGIKSRAKHYRYKKSENPSKVFLNLLMTAVHVKDSYYELALYMMDSWNGEIVSHLHSARREDRMAYISGLRDLLQLKKNFPVYADAALGSGSRMRIEGLQRVSSDVQHGPLHVQDRYAHG